ncbi:unnamed protein product [Rotaria socialis]|uniref:Uncharacterized protein n=1 Tax=Rotaria socialis TaxID=392032 RepID=A0A820V063_9BILA|nr:unnamed protein product [Rotaria socialis]
MGIKFDKINPSPTTTICPPRKTTKESTIEEKRKRKHFSVAIDVTESSTNDDFVATHYDLSMSKKAVGKRSETAIKRGKAAPFPSARKTTNKVLKTMAVFIAF